MSKTKRKQRARLGFKPNEITFKMLFDTKTTLFHLSQHCAKINMNERDRKIILTEIKNYIDKLTDRLIVRGVVTNPETEKPKFNPFLKIVK